MKHDAIMFAYAFLNENRTAALATVDTNHDPDVATIYCVADKDLTLYFTSRVEGRKFINLVAHPIVALSFARERSLESILVRGKAERINKPELEQRILGSLLSDKTSGKLRPLPPMQLFDEEYTNEVAIVKVVPFEITYAKFASHTGKGNLPIFQKII